MNALLESLNQEIPAVLDANEISLDCIGRFGPLSGGSRDTEFLLRFRSKCEKALQVMLPAPDLRPRLVKFEHLTENELTKEMITMSTYSKSANVSGKELLYRVYHAENKLVRSILENAGFKYTETHGWNVLWIGKSAKAYLYDDLNAYQRINHFPNSFEITRKDKMCLNLQAMRRKFPKDYDFFPETYIIPKDIGDFTLKFYEEDCQWIVKPCNSSQGKGIFLLESLNSLDLDSGCIVSRYIENPLLVNNLKSDLRIYVLVNSFEPLKIYVYEEGLARFACEDYNTADSTNKYMYLTNYSINKKSEKFVQNTNWEEDNIGHKWSFSAFIKELARIGYDTEIITKRIFDLIIKTVISIEGIVVEYIRKAALKHDNCFDLFGFDIMIDQNLKPWLLEVNLSPSMNTDSPLDLYIKSNLIADAFNLVGVRSFDRKKELASKTQTRIKAKLNSTQRQTSQKRPELKVPQVKYKPLFLQMLEETLRSGHFLCVFPFYGCENYGKFFNTPRKVNKVLYDFMFSEILKSENLFPGLSSSLSSEDVVNEYLVRVLKQIKGISSFPREIGRRISEIADLLNPGQEGSVARLQRYISSKSLTKNYEKATMIKGFSEGQLENMLKLVETPILAQVFQGTEGILTQLTGCAKDSGSKSAKVLIHDHLIKQNR